MKRNLLVSGIVAGPLFVIASLAQAFTRTGFDLGRHPISLLSLGSLGWVQIANFVVSGVLYLAGAIGMRDALRPGRGSTWGPLLVGAHGSRADRRRSLRHRRGCRISAGCSGRCTNDELARRTARGRFRTELRGRDRCLRRVRPSVRSAWAARLGSRGRGDGHCGPGHRRLARPQHPQRATRDCHGSPVRVLVGGRSAAFAARATPRRAGPHRDRFRPSYC